MACCKCCCEGGSPAGVCCGSPESCCVQPDKCCSSEVCCESNERCCAPDCCTSTECCVDGSCVACDCSPPCSSLACQTCTEVSAGVYSCVDDCSESECCIDGVCSTCPPETCPAVPCSEGSCCVDGYCVTCPPTDCSGDPCPEGECCVDGVCETCTACSPGDCGPGLCCVDGYCVDCPPAECPDSPCPSGECCVDGYCVACPCDPECDLCSECVEGECVSSCQPDEFCCGGVCQASPCPDPDCAPCSNLISARSCANDAGQPPFNETIRSELVCGGVQLTENYQYCDCQGLSIATAPCSQAPFSLGPEYSACTCMQLGSACNNYSYNIGNDENGDCNCVKFRSVLKYRYVNYRYDSSACKWLKISESVQSFGGECAQTDNCTDATACPEMPTCTPPVCEVQYSASDCDCEFP